MPLDEGVCCVAYCDEVPQSSSDELVDDLEPERLRLSEASRCDDGDDELDGGVLVLERGNAKGLVMEGAGEGRDGEGCVTARSIPNEASLGTGSLGMEGDED